MCKAGVWSDFQAICKMFAVPNSEESIAIKKELEEDDDRFQNNLQLLEEWMKCHPFIPKNYEKEMLPIYLRSCKHNMEKTKKKLEAYFAYKKRYPESFEFVIFNDKEQRALNNFYFYESSRLSPEGYNICFTGFRSHDATGSDYNVISKIICLYSTYKAHKSQLNSGIVIVANLKILSPALLTSAVTPSFKRAIEMTQIVYPFRIRGIYATHLPGYAVPVMKMIRMFYNEKLRKRVILESGNEQMMKAVPLYCLPIEFGGTDGQIEENYNNFRKALALTEPWFKEYKKVQAVGEVPEEMYAASGIDEDLGTQGSFRKLPID